MNSTPVIMAGITTFNPDLNQLKKNIDAIITQVEKIILVDNGSKNASDVRELVMQYENTIYPVYSPENMGIASALNIILKTGQSLGAEWVLTLDQDSVCPKDMIARYRKYMEHMAIRHPDTKTGIFCATVLDKSGTILEDGAKEITSVKRCITSGSLTSCSAWEAIGGFDERMFIDGVDFDYCDRLVAAGYKILRIRSVVLSHELGDITLRRFLFWEVKVKNHSAFRRYYIARNGFYLARKEHSPILFFITILRIIKYTSVILLYENDKLAKIKALAKGCRDGIKMEV